MKATKCACSRSSGSSRGNGSNSRSHQYTHICNKFCPSLCVRENVKDSLTVAASGWGRGRGRGRGGPRGGHVTAGQVQCLGFAQFTRSQRSTCTLIIILNYILHKNTHTFAQTYNCAYKLYLPNLYDDYIHTVNLHTDTN